MQVKDFSSRFRLDLDSVSMSLEVSSSFSKCIMIRTSIRLPTMVGRSRVLNAFKAFILTCKVPRGPVDPMNVRSFRSSRG